MTKNIIVLDENNNEIGQTYPKRVKGLIKRGRAEFVDEGTIRLVASPFPENERTQINMDNKQDILNKIDSIIADSRASMETALSTLEKADDPVKANAVSVMVQAHELTLSKAIKLYGSLLLADTPIARATEKAADSGSLNILADALEDYKEILDAAAPPDEEEIAEELEEKMKSE